MIVHPSAPLAQSTMLPAVLPCGTLAKREVKPCHFSGMQVPLRCFNTEMAQDVFDIADIEAFFQYVWQS